MAVTSASIETRHEAMVHDAQLDYYGKRLATASSDRTVRVHEVDDPESTAVILRGHESPVFGVAWAHPCFGSIVASCAYSGKVVIWREESPGEFSKFYEHTVHSSSVNSIAFADHKLGLILACASSDGSVSVLQKSEDTAWEHHSIASAHLTGVNTVCWADPCPPGALGGDTNVELRKRLVTGGCDNDVKVWRFSEAQNRWEEEAKLQHHKDWVRGVAFAPNNGLPTQTIASCGQDGDVVVWTLDDAASTWNKVVIAHLDDTPWSVSFSLSAALLAVASGDGQVSLWKEDLDGAWRQISSLTEAGSDF